MKLYNFRKSNNIERITLPILIFSKESEYWVFWFKFTGGDIMYIVTYKIGNKSYDYQIKANTSKE